MTWSKQIAEAILIGFLLGIGFVAPALWWLPLFGIGYVVALLQAGRFSIGTAWLAWGVKYLLALWWFWSVYPLDWLPIDLGWWQVIGITFYWLTAAVWLGSGAILLVVAFRLLDKLQPVVAYSSVPVFWLLGELAGALVFSLATYGPGASIGAQFSFGFIGYHLTQHVSLVQLASLAGVYGLTLVVVALGVGGWFLVTRQRWVWLAGGTVVLLGTSLWAGPFSQTADQPTTITTIATVNTTIPTDSWQSEAGQRVRATELQAAYGAARDLDPDYIIFPEDSRLFDQQAGTSTLLALLAFTSTSSDPLVLDSSRIERPAGAVLQSAWFDPASQTLTTAHKRYLVPQGEFMPYAYFWALRLVGLGDTAEQLRATFSYVVGEETAQHQFAAGLPPVLFCFESVDPRGIKRAAAARADVPFVAHVVSHGWFHEPHTLWPQLEAMLRVQAIWNDTYVVVAGNHTAGYVVDPQGRITVPTSVASGRYWQVTLSEIPLR